MNWTFGLILFLIAASLGLAIWNIVAAKSSIYDTSHDKVSEYTSMGIHLLMFIAAIIVFKKVSVGKLESE